MVVEENQAVCIEFSVVPLCAAGTVGFDVRSQSCCGVCFYLVGLGFSELSQLCFSFLKMFCFSHFVILH